MAFSIILVNSDTLSRPIPLTYWLERKFMRVDENKRENGLIFSKKR
jgi:hypothetical protein